VAETRPRLGFLGVGWIGRQRMQVAQRAGVATVAAIADRDRAAARVAAAEVGCDQVCADLDQLLNLNVDLDGIVIATPTALHASQATNALAAGLPVFCQKPLGRTAAECAQVIDVARGQDLLLGVDMSYRHLAAVKEALARLRAGEIGPPYAAELIFHNAYGPDKEWVRDVELAGGGALIDLGCHLLDLARLFLGELEAVSVHADLFAAGRRLPADPGRVEDLALAQLTLASGKALRLACSWWLPAGADAVIEATVLGAGGALRIANVAGSFYDFGAQLIHGRDVQAIAQPPDDWGGRALISWAAQLAASRRFDAEIAQLLGVAALIDRIYGRAG
jgi:predicted dehydrogenase